MITVPISATWLRRSGDKAQLLVELEGRWRLVAEELLDNCFSHISEADGGITAAPLDPVTEHSEGVNGHALDTKASTEVALERFSSRTRAKGEDAPGTTRESSTGPRTQGQRGDEASKTISGCRDKGTSTGKLEGN